MSGVFKTRPPADMTETQVSLMADAHDQLLEIISDFAVAAMADFHHHGLTEAHLIHACVGALTGSLGQICRQHVEQGQEARFAEMVNVMVKANAGLLPTDKGWMN